MPAPREQSEQTPPSSTAAANSRNAARNFADNQRQLFFRRCRELANIEVRDRGVPVPPVAQNNPAQAPPQTASKELKF